MSVDSASKFIEKIQGHDADAQALLPEGMDSENIGAEDIAAITASANAAGWDFAADELQEAYLNLLALDESELAAVAGGYLYDEAKGPGGCSSNYYAEQCDATWQAGSHCTCTDFHYNQPHTVV